MTKSIKVMIGLALLVSLAAVRPAHADEATAAFQANVQRALATLDQMQALFVRIDQRHQAAVAASATTPAPAKPEESR